MGPTYQCEWICGLNMDSKKFEEYVGLTSHYEAL
jgi:hypothetical protein